MSFFILTKESDSSRTSFLLSELSKIMKFVEEEVGELADADPEVLRLPARTLAVDGVRETIWRRGTELADLRRRSLLKKLLFLFLRGANDGLNALIPYGDSAYSTVNRPTLYIPPNQAIDTGSDRGIHGGIWPAPPEAPSFVQLFIEVDDCDSYVKSATSQGATVLMPPQALPDGDVMAILKDPNGMSFGIVKARLT